MRDHARSSRAGSRADFSAYVVARWPHLVAALRSKGLDHEAAEQAVTRALASCRSGWARLVREADVDVEVWAAVREEAGLAPAPGAVVPLDGDVEPPDPLAGVPDLDPLARVHEEVRRRRRRGARVTLSVVAALLVGVGAWTWWDSRPPAPKVVEAANPVPVPWYADGRLHLAEVVVTLPGVVALAPQGDAVVVVHRDGTWWRVAPDGDVDQLDGKPSTWQRAAPAPATSPGLVLGFADRVVDGTTGPDGAVVHLLDNSVAGASHGTYVRLSGTGRIALVVCQDDGRTCGEPRTVSTSGEPVLLR